jgi:hypothetical protein
MFGILPMATLGPEPEDGFLDGVPLEILMRMLPIISAGGFRDGEIYCEWNSRIWDVAIWRGALWS